MAMFKQSRSFGAHRLAARVFKVYADLAAGIDRLVGGQQVGMDQIDAVAHARAAQLFAQALHEASNMELDWLWYAANMTSNAQRRHCLQRALAINPGSQMARRALAKLPTGDAL
jgi:hypothetical protein